MPRKKRTEVGTLFDRCVRDVTASGTAANPSAVCASTMRRAYGVTSGPKGLGELFADMPQRAPSKRRAKTDQDRLEAMEARQRSLRRQQDAIDRRASHYKRRPGDSDLWFRLDDEIKRIEVERFPLSERLFLERQRG